MDQPFPPSHSSGFPVKIDFRGIKKLFPLHDHGKVELFIEALVQDGVFRLKKTRAQSQIYAMEKFHELTQLNYANNVGPNIFFKPIQSLFEISGNVHVNPKKLAQMEVNEVHFFLEILQNISNGTINLSDVEESESHKYFRHLLWKYKIVLNGHMTHRIMFIATRLHITNLEDFSINNFPVLRCASDSDLNRMYKFLEGVCSTDSLLDIAMKFSEKLGACNLTDFLLAGEAAVLMFHKKRHSMDGNIEIDVESIEKKLIDNIGYILDEFKFVFEGLVKEYENFIFNKQLMYFLNKWSAVCHFLKHGNSVCIENKVKSSIENYILIANDFFHLAKPIDTWSVEGHLIFSRCDIKIHKKKYRLVTSKLNPSDQGFIVTFFVCDEPDMSC